MEKLIREINKNFKEKKWRIEAKTKSFISLSKDGFCYSQIDFLNLLEDLEDFNFEFFGELQSNIIFKKKLSEVKSK